MNASVITANGGEWRLPCPVRASASRDLNIRVKGNQVVPQGQFESSPAFQRREPGIRGSSPGGTAEVQPSLRDSTLLPTAPGIEMPGYFQMILRNSPIVDAPNTELLPVQTNATFPLNRFKSERRP